MNVDVYDTYPLTNDGRRMHFDMFLPAGCGARCSEAVRPDASTRLETRGHLILPMEACPS